MNWLLENLGLVIVVAVAAVSFLRGVFRTLKGDTQAPRRPSRRMEEDPEAAERTRRVQEEIRRKIAERRAAASETFEQSTPAPEVFESPRERIPPLVRRSDVPPVDPFGGPMRKIVRKLEEAAEAAERKFEAAEEWVPDAAVERQRRLEAEMRALEAERAAEQRRAAEISAAVRREERLAARAIRDAGVRTAASSLHEQLRNPADLRRAILLREVLGPPVGLR